jgi:hypothetical protein
VVAQTLTALKDSVKEEQRVNTFDQYLANEIEAGRLTGRLIYDTMATEEGFDDQTLRTFFENFGKTGNLFDDFKDFKKDQETASLKLTLVDRLGIGCRLAGSLFQLTTTRHINPLYLFYSLGVDFQERSRLKSTMKEQEPGMVRPSP